MRNRTQSFQPAKPSAQDANQGGNSARAQHPTTLHVTSFKGAKESAMFGGSGPKMPTAPTVINGTPGRVKRGSVR